MYLKLYFCLAYILMQLVLVNCDKYKSPRPYNMTKQNPKFSNPGYIKDRNKKEIVKPEMPDWWTNRFRLPYNPAWMDYCDPYHCNDYHKTACGLNRNTMKFKWFQSGCHIIMNNMCSTYRGSLKYDMVDNKYCLAYVMFLRTKCEPCTDKTHSPVCGMSVVDYHTVLFKNKCALKMANCAPATLNEYKQIEMVVCTYFELYSMGIDPFTGEHAKKIIQTH